MNILVCNDDGIDSEGIRVLAKCLSKEHNVLVVAPDGNRSAFSHSLTISSEIRMKEAHIDDVFRSYSITGTPADCVKFATHVFTDFHTDLVCSGINRGHNLGTDTIYSGTVAAGLEANALGLPAIAFSSCAHEGNLFGMCGVIAVKIVDKFRENLSPNFVYNVNIPNDESTVSKPVKMTKLGIQIYSDEYVLTDGGAYKLIGVPLEHDKNDIDCDVEWNRKGYVTVTPIKFDKTDYDTLKVRGGEFTL